MASIKQKVEELSAIERENKNLKRRLAECQKQLDAQNEQLEAARKSKFDLEGALFGSRNLTKSKSKAKAFCRVIIPDTHGSSVDTAAIAALLDDLEIIKPSEIIMLGDHLECGGFLAQHHTLGYVAQTAYNFEDDAAATNQLLDAIQSRTKNAHIEYVEGNHESRIGKFIVDATVSNPKDSKYLLSMFSPQIVMHLDKRKIPYYEQGVKYDGLPIPGTIKRQSCHFTHGAYTNESAALKHVRKYGGNVVFGHIHRAQSAIIRTVAAGEIGGWCPGCLCTQQPMWRHTDCTDWSHGYGLQIVQGDKFLHINIPIINGISYMSPLAARLQGGR